MIGRLGKIAARIYALIVIENVNAAATVVNSHPWEPLGTIVTGSAVDPCGIREGKATIGAALKNDVRAILQVIVGKDEIDGTLAGTR